MTPPKPFSLTHEASARVALLLAKLSPSQRQALGTEIRKLVEAVACETFEVAHLDHERVSSLLGTVFDLSSVSDPSRA